MPGYYTDDGTWWPQHHENEPKPKEKEGGGCAFTAAAIALPTAAAMGAAVWAIATYVLIPLAHALGWMS